MHVTRLAIPDQFPRLLAQKVARLGRGKAKESALRFHFIRTLKNNVPRLKPRHVLLGALAYLAVSWTVIIAVDFLNLFGLQRFTMDIAPLPMLWYELYSEGSWTERLQWLLLAVALWTTFRLLLLARKQSHTPTYVAATALSCGLLFMLVEDSLNFRHIVSDVYLTAWISDPLPRRIRMVWEVTFYSLLAVLMATGLWFLWRGHRLPPRLWALIMIAYGVYGRSASLPPCAEWVIGRSGWESGLFKRWIWPDCRHGACPWRRWSAGMKSIQRIDSRSAICLRIICWKKPSN